MGILPRSSKSFYRFSLSIFFFVLGVNFASWASRIPDVKMALQLNDAQLGMALLAAPLGQLPAILLAGILVTRLGSRRVLVLGLLAYALMLLLLGMVGSPGQLFGTLLLFGLFGNLFDNALNTQAVGIEKIYRRSVMSTFHGLWSLGGLAGGFVGAAMATFQVIPRTHFLLILLFSLLLLLGFLRWTLPRDVRFIHEPAPAKKSFAMPDGRLVLLGIIAFCAMATEGAMYNWSAVYFASELHASVPLIRLGYIACMAAMVCGRFVDDRLVMRFGHIHVLRASGLLIALGAMLLVLTVRIWLATLGFMLVGLGMASGVPLAFSLAGKSKRMAPSFSIAMVTAISFFGFMISPPLIGFLSHATCLRHALLPIAAAGLCMAWLSSRLNLSDS